MSNKSDSYKILGIFGKGISHTLSPLIHGKWMKKHGIKGVYTPIDTDEKNLKDCLVLFPKIGFVGLNVTVPYKETVMNYCDFLSDSSKKLGAVNTLLLGEDGKISGFNTDVNGIMDEIKFNFSFLDIEKGNFLILGAGGAAKAAVYALLELGCSDINITNRTDSRALEVCNNYDDGKVNFCRWEDRYSAVSKASIIINATRSSFDDNILGGNGLSMLKPGQAVFNMNYFFEKDVDIGKKLSNSGIFYRNGLGMLFYQARESFRIWFGVLPEVKDEDFSEVFQKS